MPAFVPFEERFWSKVEKKGPDECWPWTGARTSAGVVSYGRIRLSRQRKTANAHSVSFKLAYGEVPNGKIVCHRCGNALCVNPSHLYAGTYSNNIQDSIRHGTFRTIPMPGEKHPMAKLTEAQVSEIRTRLGKGDFGSQIAREYGVSNTQISRIRRGHSWNSGERILLVETDALLASNRHEAAFG